MKLAVDPRQSLPFLRRPGLLFLGLMIIFLGAALVVFGSFENGAGGACFFWLVPIIVGCGFSQGVSLAPVVLFATFLVITLVLASGVGRSMKRM